MSTFKALLACIFYALACVVASFYIAGIFLCQPIKWLSYLIAGWADKLS